MGIFENMKVPEAKERFAPQKASKLNHQNSPFSHLGNKGNAFQQTCIEITLSIKENSKYSQ